VSTSSRATELDRPSPESSMPRRQARAPVVCDQTERPRECQRACRARPPRGFASRTQTLVTWIAVDQPFCSAGDRVGDSDVALKCMGARLNARPCGKRRRPTRGSAIGRRFRTDWRQRAERTLRVRTALGHDFE
jgi:hypothetical protein